MSLPSFIASTIAASSGADRDHRARDEECAAGSQPREPPAERSRHRAIDLCDRFGDIEHGRGAVIDVAYPPRRPTAHGAPAGRRAELRQGRAKDRLMLPILIATLEEREKKG